MYNGDKIDKKGAAFTLPISDAQKRANTAYNRRQDNIMIRPSKEDGTKIRAAAAAAGKSVQRYILDIVLSHSNPDEKGS